jgi:OOP family OmpA-OmpF porin
VKLSFIGLALVLAGAAAAQETLLQLELVGSLDSQKTFKGDRILARVVSPEALKGDMVDGVVKDVKNGKRTISFTLDTLHHPGQTIALNARLISISNAKGQAEVDEDAHAVRRSQAPGPMEWTCNGGLRFDSGAKFVFALAPQTASLIAGLAVKPAAAPVIVSTSAPEPERPLAEEPPAYTPPPPPPPPRPAAPVRAAEPDRAAPGGTATAQPDFKVLKDEFIPGEKTILYDDFTDMAADEAPPHWKARGGSLTLKAAGALRKITAYEAAELTASMATVPTNYTVEADVAFEKDSTHSGGAANWYFLPKGADSYTLHVSTQAHGDDVRVIARTQDEALVDTEFQADTTQTVKEAIWVQEGRVRVFVNGKKVLDANHVETAPVAAVKLALNEYFADGQTSLSRVRIAESTPDFSKSISGSGRYVTHGILFDTDSDRIKPESAPILRSIARGLELNAELKLRIEGHTDSTGAAAHNLDLSKRRAEAVKGVLVSQFGIQAARLFTEGLGAAKPLEASDTPQARAQNRRVEFVKQ